jgi:hypothetical protein
LLGGKGHVAKAGGHGASATGVSKAGGVGKADAPGQAKKD